MPRSTRLYVAAILFAATAIGASIMGDREYKREHEQKAWAEADKEPVSDGVSGVPGE